MSPGLSVTVVAVRSSRGQRSTRQSPGQISKRCVADATGPSWRCVHPSTAALARVTSSTSAAPTYLTLFVARDVLVESERSRRFGRGVVQIAGAWGLAATPDDVVQACALTAAAWSDRAVDAYDLSPQPADPRASLPSTARGFSIPEGARRLLDPFRRFGA